MQPPYSVYPIQGLLNFGEAVVPLSLHNDRLMYVVIELLLVRYIRLRPVTKLRNVGLYSTREMLVIPRHSLMISLLNLST